MPLTSVVLTHRNQLFREGLRQLLRNLRYSVVAEGANLGSILTHEALLETVDIVIWSHDGMEAIPEGESQALRRLKQAVPTIRLVALVEDADGAGMLSLLHFAEIDAILTEDISAEVLERTLDMVMLGQGVFPTAMRRLLTLSRPVEPLRVVSPSPGDLGSRIADTPPELPPAEIVDLPRLPANEPRPVALSSREEQVLYCLAKGFPNKLIARQLCLSEATVKVHVKGLLRKIQVANRTQAAIWAHGTYFKIDGIDQAS